MVSIYVGPRPSGWSLPKKLLSYHSPFFANAFRGPFPAGCEKSIELKDDDIYAFKLLVQWMSAYGLGKPQPLRAEGMRRPSAEDEAEEPEVDLARLRGYTVRQNVADAVVPAKAALRVTHGLFLEKSYLDIWAYVRLYVLADKLGMISLQDQTIDVLRDGRIHCFAPRVVSWIYQNTVPCSPLRKCASSFASSALLLKLAVPTYYDDVCAQCGDFESDLLQALVREASEVVFSRKPFYDGSCALHLHKEGETCSYGKLPLHSRPRFGVYQH